jgi:Tfp pilus assembly protein PilF
VELEAERLKQIDPIKADITYQKGLEQFPQSGLLLGSYANFLRDYRKDNIRAEDYYQRAINVDGNNVDLIQNYALFLAKVRKDYDRAEELYAKAILVDGNNARTIGAFASFLAKLKRDPKRAEEFYRKAMAADSGDPYIQASFAGFLLAQGREDEGMGYLTKLMGQSGNEETPNLALECWFYQLAHGPYDKRGVPLANLKRAIKSGKRRSGLILAPNVIKARQANHPDSPWLEKLASVINDEANANILDDWPTWKAS